jgi:hypothetical protein
VSGTDDVRRVESFEKAASDGVGSVPHEIWDVHATSRLVVITNPTNLYSQDDFRSRDKALTFHIGFVLRMITLQGPLGGTSGGGTSGLCASFRHAAALGPSERRARLSIWMNCCLTYGSELRRAGRRRRNSSRLSVID